MHTHTPRHVLITGGAGFIGCHFIRHLLSTDKQVRIVNLDLLSYAGSQDNLKELPDSDRHIFIHGDICDHALVAWLLREYGIDTVVHFAAESHVDRSITGPAAFIQTNVVGSFTLLDAVRDFWLQEKQWGADVCRFHHISTDEVYGSLALEEPPFCETTPYTPNSPYAASKAAADHLVRAYYRTYGLPTTRTNCSNNYGPFQHKEKFIPTIIKACLEKKPIPVYGDGSNIRDWLYVTDHCTAVDTVIRRGRIGETYNVGSCNEWNNLDIVRMLCVVIGELTGEPVTNFSRLVRFVTDRPGHDWRYALDSTKIRQELGWYPAESFESGLHKTVEWYLHSHSEQL